MIEAVILGPGQSFYDLIKTPFKQPNVKYYGTGKATYYTTFDYYVVYDQSDLKHRPDNYFHPGCIIYAGPLGWQSGLYKYDGLGNNAESLALSLACETWDHVGLVGFETTPNLHEILNHWQSQGKYLYTLMSDSHYNNRLLNAT